jgi:hypothetical protein
MAAATTRPPKLSANANQTGKHSTIKFMLSAMGSFVDLK